MGAIFLTIVTAFWATTTAMTPATPPRPSQCPRADAPVRKQLRFARGRATAVVKDRIRLCTSHEYYLRARAGQTMSVRLVAGDKTSFTLHAPTEQVADADGVKDWSGRLPESGRYQISIGTDATATYTLEVTIR